MRAARIIIDQDFAIKPEWCWRDDWYTGLDSAFGLLMKFAALNALTAKELAQIFISKNSKKRASESTNPNVDLRDSSLFDLETMSQIFRLSITQVRSAFLLDLLPNSRSKSAYHLRWCEQCAVNGFHAAIFQINFLEFCPLHSTSLRKRCAFCNLEIPYRLRTDVFRLPFRCPNCSHDIAPGMRNDKVKVLSPPDSERERVGHIFKYLQYEDASLSAKLEVNSKRLQLGQEEIIFSHSDYHNYLSRHVSFVSQVLEKIGYADIAKSDLCEMESTIDPLQLKIGYERVDQIRCGQSRMISFEDDDELKESLWPVFGYLEREEVTSVEDHLDSLFCVYKALRRHIWRHLVHSHKKCIFDASRHFWWRMEGEVTSNFCPVAEAFIRWRMLWEGCGTPRYLFASRKKDLFGIIGWISARPSPCPTHWSQKTKLWVTDHIFAHACLQSFREQLVVAERDNSNGKIQWDQDRSVVRHDTLWALAGCDCKDKPAIIFVQCPAEVRIPIVSGLSYRRHASKNKTQLSTIRR